MKKKLFGSLILFVLAASMLFAGCSRIEELARGNLNLSYKVKDGEAIVTRCPDKSALTVMEIPDEYDGVPVTAVADFAAVNTENLEKIIIGKNVREIAPWAFENNHNLVAFEVDEENQYFCDVDGVLFTKDMKTILNYPAAKPADGNEDQAVEYDIPEGVEIIRTKAFYKCERLSAITIPQGVKSIEEKAFFKCGLLTEMTLPSSLEFIGKDAFAYCVGIGEIKIPSGVTKIDEYAFYNCTALKNVYVDNAESNLELGQKWFPTDNGRERKDLEIKWAR